jgi:hypothetical protein
MTGTIALCIYRRYSTPLPMRTAARFPSVERRHLHAVIGRA